MFDLRTNTVRWETNCQNGVVGVEFDRKDIEMNKLIVTTLESRTRISGGESDGTSELPQQKKSLGEKIFEILQNFCC